ncbi:Ger(x)C family spore germination protein [Thermoflavimicrobium daqui]|uniref:Ger(x)C family spore germination protein n=1 Tax=Thermoflavimicrobium daqui TaxID=2137476 RepID=UPI00143CFA10|nr:Ger(x)C family spore germination protein [Thermoflavimicrobium daqui]
MIIIRASCVVLIAKGQAKDIFEIKVDNEIPVNHLLDVANNQDKDRGTLSEVTLQKMLDHFASEESFLVQSVMLDGKKVKFEEAAIIDGKKKKLIGFLNDKELEGLSWFFAKEKGGTVVSRDPKTNQMVVFSVKKLEREIQPKMQGKRISFDVKLKVIGQIEEDRRYPKQNFELSSIQQAEKAVAAEIKKKMMTSLSTLQSKYKTDVIQFGTAMRIQYPRQWQQLKQRWEEEFSQASVNYDIKVDIRNYGTIGGRKQKSDS